MSVTLVKSRPEFQKLIESNTYVALQATASWCGPCKAISPIFAKQADAATVPDKYAFAKFDIDDVPDLSQELGIASIPAFFFFENGNKDKDFKGAVPPKLIALIEEYSAKVKAAGGEETLKTDENF